MYGSTADKDGVEGHSRACKQVLEEKELHQPPKDLTLTPRKPINNITKKPNDYRNYVGPPELSKLDALEIKFGNHCTKHARACPTRHGARTNQYGPEQATLPATT